MFKLHIQAGTIFVIICEVSGFPEGPLFACVNYVSKSTPLTQYTQLVYTDFSNRSDVMASDNYTHLLVLAYTAFKPKTRQRLNEKIKTCVITNFPNVKVILKHNMSQGHSWI